MSGEKENKSSEYENIYGIMERKNSDTWGNKR